MSQEELELEDIYDAIYDLFQPAIEERFMSLSLTIRERYMEISGQWLIELTRRGIRNDGNPGKLEFLAGLVIGIHSGAVNTTITRATSAATADIRKLARELHSRFSIITPMLKAEKKRLLKEKKQRKLIKKKNAELLKTEGKRAKEAIKLQKQKLENRTRNTICKNDIEFITQEDIEDIPTEDLTHIMFEKSIYCLDKDSFKNMIKYSKDQKVRGACKPAVSGQPLECEWFYPINIGQNVYINEDNYYLLNIEKRKYSLTNKRIVDFTTGLHIMSEKSGKDAVYDLVAADFSIAEVKKIQKIVKSVKKSFTKLKLNVKDLRKLCKSKGIKGYSKWNKADLVKNCAGDKEIASIKLKSKTVQELRADCKKKGIRGYSKMKKSELVRTCGQ